MCILAIESSTSTGSVALLDDSGVLLFEEFFTSDRSHNVHIFTPLEKAMRLLGERSLAVVVVGSGPGSYTGTRVGLAAGDGIALGHRVPMAVMPSILTLAEADDFDVVGDARRGSFYLAEIRKGRMECHPGIFPMGILETRLPTLHQPLMTSDAEPIHPLLTAAIPSACLLARRWLALDAGEREQLLQAPCEPLYLLPPHVTTPKPRPSIRG